MTFPASLMPWWLWWEVEGRILAKHSMLTLLSCIHFDVKIVPQFNLQVRKKRVTVLPSTQFKNNLVQRQRHGKETLFGPCKHSHSTYSVLWCETIML